MTLSSSRKGVVGVEEYEVAKVDAFGDVVEVLVGLEERNEFTLVVTSLLPPSTYMTPLELTLKTWSRWDAFTRSHKAQLYLPTSQRRRLYGTLKAPTTTFPHC